MLEYPIFTKEMMKDYTILVPTMLPMHFAMLVKIFNHYGYKCELLENTGTQVITKGLKYVHNDTCYPAQLVIGQLMDAVQSGKYNTDKLALMISQTGGGCRASNYLAILRKALDKAGYGHIPVISLNFSGLEKGSAFKLSVPMVHRLIYAVAYGDLLMCLKNQCLPYEVNAGDTQAVCDKWTKLLSDEMVTKRMSYRRIKKNYDKIVSDFASIKMNKTDKVKVGVVGEIFVKFSPLGNNNLEQFLVSEGAEVVVPGLMGFVNYSIESSIIDNRLYGMHKKTVWIYKLVYKFIHKKELDLINAIKRPGVFDAPSDFDHTKRLIEGYISSGVKMGEGWLLPAEMLELVESGVKNIVCTQPFGCLPNHIVGKGMMKPIKERHQDVNIVAIDYDAGTTGINQENRIKLMLANAKR